jgi:hypothetical protein
MMEEVCLAMKCSRNYTCFVIGVKQPLAVTSRHRSASIPRPKQKRHKITPSGNDKSGLACFSVENQAQAAPIDSLRYSKSRITLGRESI